MSLKYRRKTFWVNDTLGICPWENWGYPQKCDPFSQPLYFPLPFTPLGRYYKGVVPSPILSSFILDYYPLKVIILFFFKFYFIKFWCLNFKALFHHYKVYQIKSWLINSLNCQIYWLHQFRMKEMSKCMSFYACRSWEIGLDQCKWRWAGRFISLWMPHNRPCKLRQRIVDFHLY